MMPPREPGDARLLTFGHGTSTQHELVDLLRGAEVASVVDVRRFPGSRRHPHVKREAMQRWLPAAGIDYRWDERLGGRRKIVPGSAHVGLRNESFRAYADHLESATFREAAAQLRAEATERRTAIMCSESLWWRCHRRLVADHLVLLAGIDVDHLFPDGSVKPHQPTDVVRVEDDRLVYDGEAS